ncbi:helix-turn-helix domain-containing protein [Paracoccus marcusii]|uniref:helix-turn-helix domain-containing protein n=1 Tax=Paracoccus marcusii TaxID=59779 RepID=UPI003CD0CCF6
MTGRPWTPKLLAERWGCSGETVRQMVRSGQLPHFLVGRGIRITQQAVEEYECRTIVSGGLRADMSSCGTTTPATADDFVLRHTNSMKPKAKHAK